MLLLTEEKFKPTEVTNIFCYQVWKFQFGNSLSLEFIL